MSQNSGSPGSSAANRWDVGRFVKTLSYFGVVPFLSNWDWFQQWFGSRPDPKVDSRRLVPVQSSGAVDTETQSTQQILVIGSTSAVGQQLVQQLTAQNYRFRSIEVDELSELTDGPNGDAVICDAVICCTEASQSRDAALLRQVENSVVRQPIFDFAQPSTDLQEIWGALDDVVMGGVSQSSIRLGDGVAYFSGVVSTANSGGFASVRTRNLEPPLDLSAYEGVELRVKGDGKRYKFMLRSETRWDGVAYCYSFDTVANEWITVRIPFSALVPVFRARTVANSSVDPSHVYAWQLMLSKFEYDGALNPHFEPGFFQLQIQSIAVYRHRPSRMVLVGATEETERLLQNSGIPYTMICPSQVDEIPGGQSLQVARQPLQGQVSAIDVAALCLAALDDSAARNLSLFVTAAEGKCAVGDWHCLFKSVAS
ncbi:MAG: CIA30 family protein [Leptolyngbya sp. IPPAS B-1204]|nr:MAG: NADH:ubiquinone oxidoreductase [Leptolyngbya sp. IPPAS B-1204]